MAYTELKLTDPLFHFTNVEAFKTIASSGQVRFSRADQTNDPFEVVWVRNSVRDFLSYMIKNDDADGSRDFWEAISHSYDEVSDPKRFFLSCWTRKVFSIPMWRLYAAEGSGVAFSLRPRAFDAFDCRLIQVEYLKDGVPTLDHLQKYASRAANEFLDLKADVRHVPLTVRLIEATLATKQSQWEYEDEFRLSYSHNEGHYESIKEHIDTTLFERFSQYSPSEAAANADRQFLFQNFGKRTGDKIDRSGSLAELVLGARCHWNKEEAMKFLTMCGYRNFKVSRSTVDWK